MNPKPRRMQANPAAGEHPYEAFGHTAEHDWNPACDADPACLPVETDAPSQPHREGTQKKGTDAAVVEKPEVVAPSSDLFDGVMRGLAAQVREATKKAQATLRQIQRDYDPITIAKERDQLKAALAAAREAEKIAIQAVGEWSRKCGTLEVREGRLREALEGMLKRYVGLVDSGDAGNWDAEAEREVIAARAALATKPQPNKE